jgi:outer membrane scaffolding protein for murein synthesis (MipA/OmpV family)
MLKLKIAAGFLAASMSISSSAMAIDWSLGAGGGVAPDYQGSDDYEFVPMWNLRAQNLYHPETYVQIVGPKLNSNLLPDNNFRLGLSAEYIFERDDVDNNQVDNMADTDDGLMLGIMGGYDFDIGTGVMGIELDGRYDLQGDVGGLLTIRGKYAMPRGKWLFNASVDSTLATDDYMEEFFGVNAADSAASGLATYNPDGGFKDVGLNAALTYQFSPSWNVTGLARYTRLIGDADDSSPVVEVGNENQFVGGVLIGFSF